MQRVTIMLVVGLVMLGLTSAVWGGVTIRVLYSHEPYVESLKRLVPEFEKKTGIKVKIVDHTYAEHYEKQKIEIAMRSSTYDIMSSDMTVIGTYRPYATNLTKLSEETGIDLKWEGMAPGVAITCLYSEGEDLYIYPISLLSGNIVVYRKDMMEDPKEKADFKQRYGYELRVPKTWDEYRDIAEFFTRDTDGDGKVDFWGDVQALEIGPAMETWNIRYTSYDFPKEVTPEFGYWLTEDYKPMINSPQGVKAVEHMVDIYRNGYGVPGALGRMWGGMYVPIAEGNAFMAYMFPDIFVPLEDPEFSKFAGKIGYGIAPDRDDPTSLLSAWLQWISPLSKHKKEALEWMVYTVNPESDLEAAMSMTRMPVRMSTYLDQETYKASPWLRAIADLLIKTRPERVRWYPSLPENDEMVYEISLAVQRAAQGEVSAKEALDDAAANIERVLAEAGYYSR